MLDHISVYVKNFATSKAFYEKALAPLGYTLLKEFEGKVGGFGDTSKGSADFWVIEAKEITPQHVAFRALSEPIVNAFYVEALAARGKDNGSPGPRPQYGDNYYAAFILDPDGHNIEVVTYKA